MEQNPKERPIRAGVFADIDRARDAVRNLLKAGFSQEQVTVICSDDVCHRNFHEFEHQEPAGSHTSSAATSGGTLGALIGATAAATGLATTGGAAVVAAGALLAGAGGAVAGGLIGAMSTRGVEKELADFYDQAVNQGKILVAVEDSSDQHEKNLQTVEVILSRAGADPLELTEG